MRLKHVAHAKEEGLVVIIVDGENGLSYLETVLAQHQAKNNVLVNFKPFIKTAL
jgi:hypothetical protein